MRSLLAALLLASASSAQAADSGTLLVLNKSDNTVSLIDLASKQSMATLETGVGPHEVAVSPDGKRAVVCTVIDLNTWEIVDRLTAGKEPDGLGYSPLAAR